jgi:hypothetical protein
VAAATALGVMRRGMRREDITGDPSFSVAHEAAVA